MKKYFLVSLSLLSLLVSSCEKEEVQDLQQVKSEKQETSIGRTNFDEIAKTLAIVVKDPKIKTYLKEEALKQFTGDYDILVQNLLQEKISSGQTVKAFLAMENKYVLDAINEDPLLTLFVPSLNSFSAESWSVENDPDPMVVIKIDNEKVKYFNGKDKTFTKELKLRPAFPVLVLKRNENLVVGKNRIDPSLRMSGKIFTAGSFSFEFIKDPDQLMKRKTRKTNQRLAHWSNLDSRIQDAYLKIFHNSDCNTCFQKDYIYYGISPTENIKEGPINLNYTEAITGIKPENLAAVDGMTNNWTEGVLEFHFKIFFIGGSKELVETTKTMFVYPDEIYTVTEYKSGWSKDGYYEEPEKIKMHFYTFDQPIEIAPWDMKVYGDRWHIEVVEYDPSSTMKETVYLETTKGDNFKLDVGFEKFIKVGAGLGTSSTTTNRSTKEVSYTTESDRLGHIIYTWYSPVVERPIDLSQRLFLMKTFSTGSVRVGIETVRTSN